MNFLSMEYFAAVAKHRNITKAAAELHITQQTLSAHIANLEKELGCTLLERKSPLELTYGGEVLLSYATEINSTHRALRSEFADISGNLQGQLRVGVATTRGLVTMPAIVSRFREEFPRIEVAIVEGSNGALCRMIQKGEVDIAIARFNASLPAIAIEPFYPEEIVMFVPKSFGANPSLEGSEALKALADKPFILNSSEDIAGQIGSQLIKEAGFRPRVAVTADSSATVLSLCALGAGICFTPLILADRVLTPAQRDELDVFRFASGTTFDISFGYAAAPRLWTPLARFIHIARDTMR